MRVASIQMAVEEGNKEKNIHNALDKIRSIGNTDLVILPELWNIGFMAFDRYVSEAESKNGPTLSAMKGAARERRIYLHTGSFVEEDQGKYYNSSYLLSPEGEILANYRKIHLYPIRSREHEILANGKSVTVVQTPIGTFGLATCYDLRYPELFRRMIEKGAETFLVCSAWPYPRLEHWIMLNRVRALENQCFLVSSNSVGFNRNAQFVGHSMIVNPWGILAASGGDEEAILRAEIDMEDVYKAREQFPALVGRQEWLNLRSGDI